MVEIGKKTNMPLVIPLEILLGTKKCIMGISYYYHLLKNMKYSLRPKMLGWNKIKYDHIYEYGYLFLSSI